MNGPSHTFVNAKRAGCKCSGFRGEIDAETEAVLLSKAEKRLDIENDLPSDVRFVVKNHHLDIQLQSV